MTSDSMQVLPLPAGCPLVVVAAPVPALQMGDPTRRYASGAGFDLEAARQGCVMEFAERLSAQLTGTEEITCATVAQLSAAPPASVVTPPEIMLIDPAQYAASAGDGEDPLLPWNPALPIGWVAAERELSMEPAWLPAGLCFLGHAADRAAGLLPAESSGLAAGISMADAAVRAFVELVECDAAAIWWYNRLVRPRFDPVDLGDPLIELFAMWCAARGRPLHLVNLTHDIGLPVVGAITHDSQGGRIALGFGAGATAVRHAIGELMQFEGNIALIEQRASAAAAAPTAPRARRLLHWWRRATIADNAFMTAGHFAAPPTGTGTAGIGEIDLARCHDLCHQHGLVLLALNLTRPMIGTPVVRVVVPGLRSLSPRFAAGRLYDVPVQLGWLPRPVPLSKLNPTAMMFGA